MKTNKLNDNLIKNLFSNNDKIVLETIQEISENGNSEYLPGLIELLNTHENETIKETIIKVLSEIKHSNAVPFFIQAIEDKRLDGIREILVRSCWENGLDYSNYFSTFIDLLIHGNYMVAFEAYTVIDSSEGTISKASSQEYITRLKDALPSVGEERQTLIHHIIQFLPGLVKP